MLQSAVTTYSVPHIVNLFFFPCSPLESNAQIIVRLQEKVILFISTDQAFIDMDANNPNQLASVIQHAQ